MKSQKLIIGALSFLVLGLGIHDYNAHQLLAKLNPLSFLSQASADSCRPCLCELQKTTRAKIARVIDGDTVVLADGSVVRYLGVDTPETKKRGVSMQYLGLEAAAANKKLVEGKMVKLVSDIEDKDMYGRLLRYVYVSPTESGAEVLVSEELLKRGLGRTYVTDTTTKKAQMCRAEEEAKQAKLGIWDTAEHFDFYTKDFKFGCNK